MAKVRGQVTWQNSELPTVASLHGKGWAGEEAGRG